MITVTVALILTISKIKSARRRKVKAVDTYKIQAYKMR